MSKLLIQESPLTFQPSLAVAIGLNEAIVLQQIHYWISNTKNKGYEQDGYKWVYNTYAEWKETNFPFWSENTIQRVFTSLEEKGLVVAIQPMKGKYDRTKYYRIEYTKLEVFEDTKSVPFDDPKLVSSLNESEITTENTTTKPDIFDMLSRNEAIAQQTRDAQIAFETALSVNPWPWDSSTIWRKFSAWVLAEYTRDPKAFEDYKVWREGQGKFKGGMTNTRIRQDPQIFMDTGWPSFLASSSMAGEVSQLGRPETQKFIPDDATKFVPRPK